MGGEKGGSESERDGELCPGKGSSSSVLWVESSESLSALG